MILVSSEHSFPFRLQQLDFNMADISNYIFAGEVPPSKMMALLQNEWGVKEHLAIALIEHYGGHIYDMYLNIPELVTKKLAFDALDPFLSHCVAQCLKVEDAMKPRMFAILQELAETGFCPLDDDADPLAEVISQSNVGGVVRSRSVAIGLPPDVFKRNGNAEYGLIPTKHSMRLAIAKKLAAYKGFTPQ